MNDILKSNENDPEVLVEVCPTGARTQPLGSPKKEFFNRPFSKKVLHKTRKTKK